MLRSFDARQILRLRVITIRFLLETVRGLFHLHEHVSFEHEGDRERCVCCVCVRARARACVCSEGIALCAREGWAHYNVVLFSRSLDNDAS